MKNNYTTGQNSLPHTLFPFIGHFLTSFKGPVMAYITFSLLAGLWGPFNSFLTKNVINALPLIQNGDISPLIYPASLIVINFILFDNLTWRGITYLQAHHTPVILNNMISATTDYVLSHSHQYFQDHLSGNLSKHITNLADGVKKIITTVASNFLRGTSHLAASFIIAYFVNPIFSFILCGWFVFFAGISIVMSRKFVELASQQARTESSLVGELVDALSNQSTIRIFAKKAYEIFRLGPYFKKQEKAYRRSYMYAFFMHATQGLLIALMMGCAIYFLVTLYAQGLLTAGDFALILFLTMQTGHLIWYTMSEVDEFNKAVGKCQQSLDALFTPLEIKDIPHAQKLTCNNGSIRFQNVTFHYKGSHPLFQNLSLEVPSGQKIGLVGYSGSGKTTFVNLILRLYDVTDGSIFIEKQNIQEVTQASLRENISLIPQDPVLFQRSLMENIRYGNITASDSEVIEAAKQAHADDFIQHLPEGYATLVGERGIKLSGGQRQRIAIARALLKNAPFLILDEATSQLDSVTENLIQESLTTLMRGKTTLVIAHRLSTLLQMDRILVFDKGIIRQDGSHEELLKEGGLYKQLWEAQVGGFLGDDKKGKP